MQVARRKSHCKVLGPGLRSVIWFHGCCRKCSGCIADTMNETAEYETLSPKKLADWVLANKDIEGITLSGGEPLMQPIDELAEFLMLVKRQSNLSVLCYTGNMLEELQDKDDEGMKNVLRLIDVLIDGEYRQELDNGQRWRGSGNQRFHFLTPRYRNDADQWYAANERQIEIELDMNGKLLISGVPSKDFINKLTAELQRREINVDFS